MMLLLSLAPALAAAAATDRAAVWSAAVASRVGLWSRVQARHPEVASRDLFTYALILQETGRHLDRVPALLALAREMQERDPAQPTHGNFFWRLSETEVLDHNAVDFCMLPGALLWQRHAEALPDGQRTLLRELLELGAEGCRRHTVAVSYTNIALMNAVDLALLGEALGRPELAAEGYRRFELVCLHTLRYGITEYNSPTYTGVDLEVLLVAEQFVRHEPMRAQARAMLELFWRSVALNWFPPSRRLGGTRSRDYDYLRGHGMLEPYAADAGLPADPGTLPYTLALCDWRPPPELLAAPLPRLVRERFSGALGGARTHFVLPDVSLSSTAMNYHNMDLPLTFDIPGDRQRVRGYFIPDGRQDPYGTQRIAAGNHQKTLHLRPFWTAAQREGVALGMVVYRVGDYDPAAPTLDSHIVLPDSAEGLFVGGRAVAPPAAGETLPVPAGAAVIVRYGSAAVALAVPHAVDLAGGPAKVVLADDGQAGAWRLTVAHKPTPATEPVAGVVPCAAFWVRVGSGLDPAGFARWSAAAEAERATVQVDRVVRVEVPGPVVVATQLHPPVIAELAPTPTRALLELNGEEIGRPLLQQAEPMRSWQPAAQAAPTVELPAAGLLLPAAQGLVHGTMAPAEDPGATGGRFVWQPGEPGRRGSGEGGVAWRLRLAEAGRWYLFARVRTPTPEDDSLYVQLQRDDRDVLGVTDWHLGVHAEWTWVPLLLGADPLPLELPAGETVLAITVREDGAQLDAVRLSRDPAPVR